MKKVLLVTLLFASLQMAAQTNGISYQAVIVGPDTQELPGADAEGNILPNATIAVRFTIIDANNMTEYQEVQTTNTDQYGRINLIIGKEDPDAFAEISWDGTNKDLKVEIDFNGGSNFEDMSREKLTFLPYAYHRNITATGTLTVDDATFLNGELMVQGPTQLNSTLNVNNGNATNLSGDLAVEGETNLNNDLEVAGVTTLKDSLVVDNQAPTILTGDLTVEGEASFNGDLVTDNLVVENNSDLKGQVRIDVASKTNFVDPTAYESYNFQETYENYPLLVEGGQQGIAIKLIGVINPEDNPIDQYNTVPLSIKNNFVSFWDDDPSSPVMWGRIQGISIEELNDDPEYKLEHTSKIVDIVLATTDVVIATIEWGQGGLDLSAALTSSTACIGVGACVTLPIPSFIISKTVNLILKVANIVSLGGSLLQAVGEEVVFLHFNRANIGVSYSSGAGDYAEWLPKENPSENFIPGELVGIKNGKVTKNTWGVDKIMIVSTNPIVLGNMPQPKDEANSVKIAFMGQVPVKVLGNVSPGDYILPNVLANGFGTAVHPQNMKSRDYKKVVGVAWNVIEEVTKGLSLVNVAVGINTNDLSDVVSNQEEQLSVLKAETDNLRKQINQSDQILAGLVPGYAEARGINNNKNDNIEVDITNSDEDNNSEDHLLIEGDEDDIIYFDITREQIESAIKIAREQYKKMLDNKESIAKMAFGDDIGIKDDFDKNYLMPLEDHPFWQKIDNNPAYKEEIILLIQNNLKESFHTHKKYAEKFSNLKVSKE